jgi:hypothetical protein
MKSEDQVLAALKALAAHDREREAPEEVELRLRATFRRARTRRTAMWSLAAAAIVATIFLALPREHPAPPVVTKPAPPPQIATVVEPPAPQIHPVRRRVAPKPPREIATEFFPLMDVPLPFDRGELLRVIVPASTMRTVGLPVNEERLADRVQADVLVGEEGLARAIRFVRYEQ